MSKFLKRWVAGVCAAGSLFALQAGAQETFEAISEAPHLVTVVETNEQAIAQRLDLIQKAQRSILIDVFYFHPDESGQIILASLVQKKKQHPEVRIQLQMDAWGSKAFPEPYIALLQSAGIEVKKYLGPALWGFGPRRKNHRKTWIIDQQFALIGGYNMGDEHFGYSPVFNMIDRDLLIEGPIAASMARAYQQIWEQSPTLTSQEHSNLLLPTLSMTNTQPLAHSPKIQVDKIRYLSDINRENESEPWMKNQLDKVFASAKKRIKIETKFFLPPFSTLAVFIQKLRGSVPVQIFANSRTAAEPIDRELIFLGGAPLQGLKWIGADVRYFLGLLPGPSQAQTEKSRMARWGTHSKTFLVDDTVVIGSFNLDPISSYMNLEHAVVIESKELASAIENSIHTHTKTLVKAN